MTVLDKRGTVGRLFARLDAVHSSGAEGSTTTFTDLMEYESALRVAPDREDAAVVAAAAAGMDESLEHGDLKGLVLKIHKRLFEGNSNQMLAARAGAFKQLPNYVRDSDEAVAFFGYTKPSSVGAALSDWSGFTLASDDGTNELVRQILSHWMFEHIHPVSDGNGRIGRLLVPIVLKAKVFTSTACAFFGEAVHEDKSLYIDALKDARISGNTTNYVRQMLSFLRRTADANIARLDRLEAIEAGWKDRFAQTRSDSVVHRLVSYAISKPVFTVRDVQKDLSVSFAAANTAVRALQGEEIVSVPEDARRNRLFHADEVLEAFDRFKAPTRSFAM
ncbi:Fic family protein [Bradyrhizobium iriomotense]|uniref:Fic family protein n=1 Tax=Bradyrhizobium iriomotense TaxID=441950 RepID=UPI0024E0691B|nr:Fic family protein [Bradyrhizobium iriomotense]